MLSERGKESPDSRSVFLKIEMPVTDNAGAEINGVFLWQMKWKYQRKNRNEAQGATRSLKFCILQRFC